MPLPFTDRNEAGRLLARRLTAWSNRPDVIVLALPRGGAPVAFEVARELRVPMDIFLVRKLGVPGHEELAMGAIASGDIRVLNEDLVRELNIPPRAIETVAATESRELERREKAYRGGLPPVDTRGRVVILVDDGLATGATMRAAAAAIRGQQPARIIVAVPIAAIQTCDALRADPNIDEVVCVETPEPFYSVGSWYVDFSAPGDREVRELLERAEDGAMVK